MKRVLVTTALECTWPKNSLPILFLGEWCKLYDRKYFWESLEFQVANYHWDDRKKLFKDYQYLNELYERILLALTTDLNAIHGKNHTTKYWRMFIGIWLGYFIQILYDRWECISHVTNNYEIENTLIVGDEAQTPKDLREFHEFFIDDDWNHFIFSNIISHQNLIPKVVVHKDENSSSTLKTQNKSAQLLFNKSYPLVWSLDALIKVCKKITSSLDFVRSKDSSLIIETMLDRKDVLMLDLKLGQLPQSRSLNPTPQCKAKSKLREFSIEVKPQNNFEEFLFKIIPKQIPLLYIEGYRDLLSNVNNSSWPKNPKWIFTSNSENSDEFFKLYTAEKVAKGSKYAQGQHGGYYGIGQWSFLEDHHISISDKYFSWGWLDSNLPKIKAVGQLRNYSWKRDALSNGILLIALTAIPRYSYHMYSIPVAGQYLNYLNDQFSLLRYLKASVICSTVVRFQKLDEKYKWFSIDRLKNEGIDVMIDSANVSMQKQMSSCKVFLATCNTSAMLEALTLNVPTIIFWNPKYWEIRDAASIHIESLHNAGVLHYDPKAAACKINAIWEDVDTWWHSDKVSSAVHSFREKYCNTSGNITGLISDELK